MNPDGGPLEASAGAIHGKNAKDKILIVDITKKEEYDRRKKYAEIDSRNKAASSAKKMAKNIGWPLNPLPPVAESKENAEKSVNPLVRPPQVDEFVAKWKKGPFPTLDFQFNTIFVQITADPEWREVNHQALLTFLSSRQKLNNFEIVSPAIEGRSFCFYLKKTAESKDVDLSIAADELDRELTNQPKWMEEMLIAAYGSTPPSVRHEVSSSPVRLRPGYLEWEKDKLVWTGPERTLVQPDDPDDDKWTREAGTLDLLLWKPLLRAWPELIDALGARDTHAAIVEGRALPAAESAEPARSHFHEYRFKDLLRGGKEVTVKMRDGRELRGDVLLREPLTGVPLLQHAASAVQRNRGHGEEDPHMQLERKRAKLAQLQRAIVEMEEHIRSNRTAITYYHEKFLKGEVPRAFALDKITPLAREIESITVRKHPDGRTEKIPPLRRQLAELRRRVAAIEVEIAALQDELHRRRELTHVDGVLPRSAVNNLPLGLLETLDDATQKARTALADAAEKARTMLAGTVPAIGSLPGEPSSTPQTAEKREEYFGRPLIDPATGRENIEVVNRKNSDMVARDRERNRAIADVLLARSSGRQRKEYQTKEERDAEMAVRDRAQKVVDDLVQSIEDNDDSRLGLEEWARSSAREKTVYGSSAFHDTSNVEDQVQRVVNYAGQTGTWRKKTVMSRAEEESIGDSFYLSLTRTVRPEDRQSKVRRNPANDFGVPPDPGSMPWTGGTSAAGAMTANSTFRGCALNVVARQGTS